MNTLPRATASLVAVVALAASLSACGSDDSDDQDAAPDASSQTCRLAAATHASLDGPRSGVARGQFTAALAPYATAMTQLGAAVSAEGEVDEEITQAVVALVGAYSRTRAFAEENADSPSYQSTQAKALTAAEVRLYDELVAVCPALNDTDEG